MKIATLEDLQAITDYWNSNLLEIEAETHLHLLPLSTDVFKPYIENSFTVWDFDNAVICSRKYMKDDKQFFHVDYWWSEDILFSNAIWKFFAEQSKLASAEMIAGYITENSSSYNYLVSKGFTFTVVGNVGGYNIVLFSD